MLNGDIVTPVNSIIICKERQSLIITLAFNDTSQLKKRKKGKVLHKSTVQVSYSSAFVI